MRISDWSSDVCSSDLHTALAHQHVKRRCRGAARRSHILAQRGCIIGKLAEHFARAAQCRPRKLRRKRRIKPQRLARRRKTFGKIENIGRTSTRNRSHQERKSDVLGKSVSERGIYGGRTIMKKNTHQTNTQKK